MWNRRWAFAAGLALCGWLTAQVASPLLAQQKGNDAPASNAEADKEKELNIRYAKAYLQLVEATMAKYQETNRRAPNTIRRGVITALQEGIRDARERVELAESDEARHGSIYVSAAEADLRNAQESLRKAETANARLSGTISQTEMARLNAELELAKIKVEKTQHLAAESQLSNVRYELNQLREDVQELRLIVALLRDRN